MYPRADEIRPVNHDAEDRHIQPESENMSLDRLVRLTAFLAQLLGLGEAMDTSCVYTREPP